MGGIRLHGGSPASSVASSDVGDSPGGGAPLYGWSPEPHASLPRGAVPSNLPSASKTANPTNITTNRGKSVGEAKTNPQSSMDQAPKTPEPAKPRRMYSQPMLHAPFTSFMQPPVVTSGGHVLPGLTLAAYPGPPAYPPPGFVPHRQPSISMLVPISQAPGFPPVPISQAPGFPPVPISQAPGFPPGPPVATNSSLLSSMQSMMKLSPEDEKNFHPSQKEYRKLVSNLQSRLWGLQQGLQRQPAVPREFLLSLEYDMTEVSETLTKMTRLVDDLAGEAKNASGEPEDRIETLEATIRELKDEVKDWKNRHQEAKDVVKHLAQRGTEDMRVTQFLKEKLRENDYTRAVLQEQVNNKRNLWLKIHTDPQERAAALESLAGSSSSLSGQTYAPPANAGYVSSPSGAGSYQSDSSHVGSVYSGSDGSAGVRPGNGLPGSFYQGGPLLPPFQGIPQSQSGPATYQSQQLQHRRRPSTSTVGSGRSNGAGYSTGYANSYANDYAASVTSSRQSTGPRRGPRVSIIDESGSPKERVRNNHSDNFPSEVRTDPADATCLTWREEFQALFALVYGFCTSYFHELPQINKDWKSHIKTHGNGMAWSYLTNICQNNRDLELGDHGLRLLGDRQARPYLMQRLILQYLFGSIFTAQGWNDFSEDVDLEMHKLERDLNIMDASKTYERQVIVDRQAQLVKEMTESAGAASFRNYKVTQHHQQLKVMLAPFLPQHSSRMGGSGYGGGSSNASNASSGSRGRGSVASEAFYDLYTIINMGWDMSAKIYQSRLTFQYAWHEVGTRFLAESHEPVAGVGFGASAVERLAMQHENTRIRLCTTPAVTMRNDQGITINTRNILKAGVLVMRS